MDNPTPNDSQQQTTEAAARSAAATDKPKQQKHAAPVVIDLADTPPGPGRLPQTQRPQPSAARTGARRALLPASQTRVVRKRKRVLRSGAGGGGKSVDVIEVHHHHHHMHPFPQAPLSESSYPQSPPALCLPSVSDTAPNTAPLSNAGWVVPPGGPTTTHYPHRPLPAGAGTWGNPVPQISYQQPTVQNQFTIILGCIVCPVATFICIVIWLAVFGVIQLTDIFGNPW